MNFIKKWFLKRKIKNYLFNYLTAKQNEELFEYFEMGTHWDNNVEYKIMPEIKLHEGMITKGFDVYANSSSMPWRYWE